MPHLQEDLLQRGDTYSVGGNAEVFKFLVQFLEESSELVLGGLWQLEGQCLVHFL